MNKIFNEIDKSISEYDKSMKEIFRLLDENAKIISDLQDDVNKMRSINNEN
jgi:methyl-accepting chemotaxis protein